MVRILDSKKAFNWGMSDHSTTTMKKILEIYDFFDGLKTLIDFDGGTRASLNMIITKHPSIKGINFDLPHVIEDAPPYPSMTIPGLTLNFKLWICHERSDERSSKFLNKCYKALPDKGKVIVAESILPHYPDPSLPKKLVLHIDCICWLTIMMEKRGPRKNLRP
ncbi:Caffeic acid 3-O-methyltransferase [Hibiscus syriacus]|uniref:Caffeic acid 3-O-methyltransferase n=1 Tax=Hibiscus syriacus TaxID=106335 RepID=A0A6A2XB27_HIBSY|nr:Caffeic acid 3-O-methyltransferase [Hibiscus syriacus]